MSEFSESFHFAKADRDQLKKALGNAGMKGVVWGPSDTGWVTFIPFEGCKGHSILSSPRTDFAGKLSKIAGKPVLIWLFAEDHEWHTVLWRDGAKVAHYVCDWNEDDVRVDANDTTLAELQKLPMRSGRGSEVADCLAKNLDQEDLLDGEPRAYRFAEALGLPKYQWASSQYLTMDWSEGEEEEGVEVG